MTKKRLITIIISIIILVGLGIGGYYIWNNYACEYILYSCDDLCWMYPEDDSCIPCPPPERRCSFYNLIWW